MYKYLYSKLNTKQKLIAANVLETQVDLHRGGNVVLESYYSSQIAQVLIKV